MNQLSSPSSGRRTVRSRYPASLVIALAASAALLAGCGGGANRDKAATQTAAKVNKEEITVHQINFILGQQRAVAPEQAASASRMVLERLIDQELVLQKAAEQKLDRDPKVAQQVEAARRDAVVRAYVERISQGATKPTPQEVAAYYASHPGLFSARKVYSLREVLIEAKPEQIESLRTQLAKSPTLADFVAWLKTNSFRYAGAESVRSAEQLPLSDVDKFAQMKDGQSFFQPRPNGVQIITLVSSRPQPVAEAQATPAIEQFLLNERKRKLVAEDLASMRGAAKVEYVGTFAADAAASPYVPPVMTDSTPVTTLAPTLPAASAVLAAPQIEVSRPDGASSMPNESILEKGLKGMR